MFEIRCVNNLFLLSHLSLILGSQLTVQTHFFHQIQLVLLDGISKILIAGEKIGQLDAACLQVEHCGGLDKIEKLQGSPNEEVILMIIVGRGLSIMVVRALG